MCERRITSTFVYEGLVSVDACHADFEFGDRASKGPLRLWCVSYDREQDYWYGALRRSKTVTDDFDFGVNLPPRLVALLVDLIPAEHLPNK